MQCPHDLRFVKSSLHISVQARVDKSLHGGVANVTDVRGTWLFRAATAASRWEAARFQDGPEQQRGAVDAAQVATTAVAAKAQRGAGVHADVAYALPL